MRKLLEEALIEAMDFLFRLTDAPGTRIVRDGPQGPEGAIFIVRDPDLIEKFNAFYYELLDAEAEEGAVIFSSKDAPLTDDDDTFDSLPTCSRGGSIEN
jgi:hypothetical protein